PCATGGKGLACVLLSQGTAYSEPVRDKAGKPVHWFFKALSAPNPEFSHPYADEPYIAAEAGVKVTSAAAVVLSSQTGGWKLILHGRSTATRVTFANLPLKMLVDPDGAHDASAHHGTDHDAHFELFYSLLKDASTVRPVPHVKAHMGAHAPAEP